MKVSYTPRAQRPTPRVRRRTTAPVHGVPITPRERTGDTTIPRPSAGCGDVAPSWRVRFPTASALLDVYARPDAPRILRFCANRLGTLYRLGLDVLEIGY